MAAVVTKLSHYHNLGGIRVKSVFAPANPFTLVSQFSQGRNEGVRKAMGRRAWVRFLLLIFQPPVEGCLALDWACVCRIIMGHYVYVNVIVLPPASLYSAIFGRMLCPVHGRPRALVVVPWEGSRKAPDSWKHTCWTWYIGVNLHEWSRICSLLLCI